MKLVEQEKSRIHKEKRLQEKRQNHRSHPIQNENSDSNKKLINTGKDIEEGEVEFWMAAKMKNSLLSINFDNKRGKSYARETSIGGNENVYFSSKEVFNREIDEKLKRKRRSIIQVSGEKKYN